MEDTPGFARSRSREHERRPIRIAKDADRESRQAA